MEESTTPSVSAAQQAAFDHTRSDRRRSLEYIQLLEAVAGGAAPGREGDWQRRVVDALKELEDALREQARSYDEPTSLLAEIGQEHPRLRTWVRQLRRQWSELVAAAASVREQLDQADESAWNYTEVRERVRWLVTALHHHRSREADLVFEALSVDLGAGD